jgi:ribosome biogenesis GTPase
MSSDGQPGALVPFGWTDRVLALFNEVPEPDLTPARVVRVESSECLVATPEGDVRPARAATLPVVGDWVALAGEVVRHVLPRWSELSRKDPAPGGFRVQVLAANVDLVVVTAPADRLSPNRVERELAVAWDSGARPLVVVTKADLAGPDDLADLRRRLVGVDVIATSAGRPSGDERTGPPTGLDEFRAQLQPDRTAVLLGPSGAGKSTLVNALLGDDLLATGAVRDGDRRGRHTTTSRQLVPVPGGGVLIDTPGLRSLGLVARPSTAGGEQVLSDAVDRVFPEIEGMAERCRYRDCGHDTEPGCAVQAALADGSLAADRWASYQKLQGELAADVRRTDPRLRQQEQAVWKSRNKALRAFYEERLR